MNQPTRARFLTMEAVDLAGKTTQLNAVSAALADAGLRVATLTYPERSAPLTGHLIDRFLAGPDAMPLVADAAGDHPEVRYRRMLLGQQLFSLNRLEMAAHLEQLMADHDVVLASRYALSGRVYAIATGVAADDIAVLHRSLESHLRQPDWTFVLDVDPALVRTRPRDGGLDDFERDASLQERVAAAYRAAAAQPGARITLVDGSGDAAAVSARMVSTVLDRLATLD